MQNIKHYSDLITSQDMQQLVNHEGSPAISLLMPTHKTAPESQQNPIRFKNLVTAARQTLKGHKLDSRTIDDVLAPVLPMVDGNAEDWRYVSEGLAVFLAPDTYYSLLNGGKIYTLPEEDVPGIDGVAAILRY